MDDIKLTPITPKVTYTELVNPVSAPTVTEISTQEDAIATPADTENRKFRTPKLSTRQIKHMIRNPKNKELRKKMAGEILEYMAEGLPRKYRVADDGTLIRLNIKTLEPLD